MYCTEHVLEGKRLRKFKSLTGRSGRKFRYSSDFRVRFKHCMFSGNSQVKEILPLRILEKIILVYGSSGPNRHSLAMDPPDDVAKSKDFKTTLLYTFRSHDKESSYMESVVQRRGWLDSIVFGLQLLFLSFSSYRVHGDDIPGQHQWIVSTALPFFLDFAVLILRTMSHISMGFNTYSYRSVDRD